MDDPLQLSPRSGGFRPAPEGHELHAFQSHAAVEAKPGKECQRTHQQACPGNPKYLSNLPRPPGLERRTFSSGPWPALEDTPRTHHDATRRLSWAAPATAGPIRADEGQKSRLVAFGGCRAPHRDRFRFPKRSEHEAGRS